MNNSREKTIANFCFVAASRYSLAIKLNSQAF